MKYFGKMFGAFVAAVLVANFFAFFYSNGAKSATNIEGFTVHKFKPHEWVSYGMEGGCIKKTDDYGFYNDSGVTPNTANIVCIGSSQTEALQVMESDSYVSQLMHMDKKNLQIYNLGISGQFMRDSLSRLPLIPKSFPKTKVIVLETPSLPSYQEWQKMLDAIDSGNVPIEDQDWKDGNFLYRLYRKTPILGLLYGKCVEIRKNSGKKVENIEYDDGYQQIADKTLALLRKKMGNVKVIIVYLPGVKLEKSGNLIINTDIEKMSAVKNACENNGIGYVDVWPYYINAYENERIVPYGHVNKYAASGHLNAQGHRLVAKALYDKLIEEGMCQ